MKRRNFCSEYITTIHNNVGQSTKSEVSLSKLEFPTCRCDLMQFSYHLLAETNLKSKRSTLSLKRQKNNNKVYNFWDILYYARGPITCSSGRSNNLESIAGSAQSHIVCAMIVQGNEMGADKLHTTYCLCLKSRVNFKYIFTNLNTVYLV